MSRVKAHVPGLTGKKARAGQMAEVLVDIDRFTCPPSMSKPEAHEWLMVLRAELDGRIEALGEEMSE